MRGTPPTDYVDRFRIRPGKRVRLDKIDPDFTDRHASEAKSKAQIQRYAERLRDQQFLLYAEDRRALLVVLQGMDTAGKDGTINHVLGAMNPQGCEVHGFKQPSEVELAHGFLWRCQQVVPAKGRVGIFNRSHYEDVLVVRVHDLVPKPVWKERYGQIRDFERYLHEGVPQTTVLKFFLHISKEEQLARFKARLDDKSKHWKISEFDYSERQFWDDYHTAYEAAIEKTTTDEAPWFVIPADNKWFRNLAVARIMVEVMEGFGMKTPKPTVDIDAIRQKYHQAVEADPKFRKKAKAEAAT